MAQRDQTGGLFCRLYAGNTRNAEHIPFFCGAGGNVAQGGRAHGDTARRTCNAMGFRLARNIDHPGLAACVEVCQNACNRLFFH
mgnify:CR=1 FL=1